MNDFKNVFFFPTGEIIFLQIYDLTRKVDVCSFVVTEKLELNKSLVFDELNLNIKDVSMSSTQKHALIRLDSTRSGCSWGFWVDSFDYLYISILISDV